MDPGSCLSTLAVRLCIVLADAIITTAGLPGTAGTPHANRAGEGRRQLRPRLDEGDGDSREMALPAGQLMRMALQVRFGRSPVA